MRELLQKKWFVAMIPSLLLAISAVVTAQLLLRNLSLFLTFDPQFSAIFAQIQDARMKTSLWLLVIPSFLYCFAMVRFCRSKVIMAVGSVLFWLVLTAAALLLTMVNGVLFWDVLVSLLGLIQKGGIG